MRKFLPILALMCAAAAAQASLVVDRSGTITTANVSQQAMPAKSSRTYLMCQNPITSTTTLFLNFDAAASSTAGSVELAPGGSITFQGSAFMITGPVNVTSATATARFTCKEG